MLSGLMMITRQAFTGLHGRLIGLVAVLAAAAVTATCDSVPLLAPSGSFITLTASTNAIAATGTAQLIAQVLEPSGTPPHPGTQVIFTTTLGVVEPATVTTDVNGRALATFRGNGVNGIATINAGSGGATTASASSSTNTGTGTTTPTTNGTGPVRIFVGAAAVGRVAVNATPATISSGGSSTITASVFDVNGSALSGTQVSFSTDAGTLASTVVTTNSDGIASTSLTTSQSATITASVGASASSGGGTGTGTTSPTGQSSGQAKVTVVPNTTVQITPPTTPSAGLPAVFTFVVTVPTGGNPVRELRVSWGDGDSQNLGAVSGSQAVSHVYDNAGSFIVTATVVDVAGISQTVSSTVTVIPVPRPAINVTPTPPTQVAGGVINFNIQVTVPQGIGVVRTRILFGDGEARELGGAVSLTVVKVYNTPGQYTVRVLVTDTTGQETEGTTTVSVTSPG